MCMLGIEGVFMGKKWLEKLKSFSFNREKIVDFLNKTSILWHMVLSVIICLFIESVSRHSVIEGFKFLVDAPLIFMYNSLIVFATFLIVYLFRKRIAMRLVLAIIWCVLGITNGVILAKRVTPFSYTDLKLIGDLFAMNSTYITAKEIVLIVIFLAIVVGLNVWMFLKAPRYKGKVRKLFSLVVVGSCFMWLPMVTEAAVNQNLLASYFENIALGYEEYGFVYGFSTSVVGTGMNKPIDYSKETIGKIEDSIKVKETKPSKEMPNIVVVLLESFIDPTDVNFLDVKGDPIPNFHYLQDNFSTGYLTVPVVGAGTANSEFEVLTGMSMRFFGTGEYPYKTILKETDCESIAGNLGDLGYATSVVHNNNAKFYSRNNAFSMMGFDTFVSREFMVVDEFNTLGTWAADNLLLEQIENVMDKSENQQDFVYCITVQGHGAYPTEKVFDNPEFEVSGADTKEMNYSWEYFVNELHYVDDFIGNLVKQLEARDEETILVLWGDHLPTMGLEDTDMVSGSIFKTRYVTWNNMNLPKNDMDLTAYQLLSYITGQVDIHKGTLFKYHQDYLNAGYSNNNETYLSGLENLQYDLLYGNRYFYHGEELHPASDLVLGIEDVKINSVATIGNILYVYGENFTASTKVFINDEQCETEFVSTECMAISLDENAVSDGDIIKANVVGQGIILRESNEFIYEQYIYDIKNPIMIMNEEIENIHFDEDVVLDIPEYVESEDIEE